MGKVGKMGNYKVRRRWIKTQIDETNIWPTAKDVQAEFPNTSESAAYRDLDAVLDELYDPIEVKKLRVQVFSLLKKKLPKLENRDVVRLAIAFIPKMIESKVEAEIKTEKTSPIDMSAFSDEEREEIRKVGRLLLRARKDSAERS